MVHHHDERLRITADNGEKCFVDQKYVPRGRWLEIEIHADYTVDGKVDDTEPSFSYLIDGQVVCQLLSPLVTTRALRDGNRKQLQLKFGIYNTFPSKWLLSQQENQEWVRANKIEFSGYQQDSKGESNGAVRSAMASPFDYDWPVKLPDQVLYYTDWFVGNSREELGPSRFRLRKSAEVKMSESPPDSTVDFSVTTREVCMRALPEWEKGGGAWSSMPSQRAVRRWMRAFYEMKKVILCKLCLIVFGALLIVQSANASNWNKNSISEKVDDQYAQIDKAGKGIQWRLRPTSLISRAEQISFVPDPLGSDDQVIQFEVSDGDCGKQAT